MYVDPNIIAQWPRPNYINPEERSFGPNIVSIVLYSIAVLSVGLRVFTRLFVSRCFGIEDALCVLALVFSTIFVALTLLAQTRYGWNRHAWDVPHSKVTIGLQVRFVTPMIWGVASSIIKLSMLLLTRRLMSTAYDTLRKVIDVAMTFVTLDIMIYVIVSIFECSPISAFWTLSFVPQQCINQRVHVLIQGCLSTIVDFLCVLLPIPVVARLHLAARQRILVSVLFGAGFVASIAGSLRTYYNWQVSRAGVTDVTWEAQSVWLSGAIELYVGLICSSLPPTRAFFTRYLPKFLPSSSNPMNPPVDETPNLMKVVFWNPVISNRTTVDSRQPDGMNIELLESGQGSIQRSIEVSQSIESLKMARATTSRRML